MSQGSGLRRQVSDIAEDPQPQRAGLRSEDGYRIDRRTCATGKAQRRDHAQKLPPTHALALVRHVLELEVIEQEQAHRVDRENVYWEPHTRRRARRGVAVGVAA